MLTKFEHIFPAFLIHSQECRVPPVHFKNEMSSSSCYMYLKLSKAVILLEVDNLFNAKKLRYSSSTKKPSGSLIMRV